MRIKIRCFALARQLTGASMIVVDVPEPATVASVRKSIANTYPMLQELLTRVRIAVDSEYAGDDHPIFPHSEVALIPPVSGGFDG